MRSHAIDLAALALLAVLASACKGSAECSRYDFNGGVYKKWYECSDQKTYELDCKVAQGTFDCACKVDGKETQKVSYANKDKKFMGKDEEKASEAATLCGWGELTLKKK